jgi:hypothetical protein
VCMRLTEKLSARHVYVKVSLDGAIWRLDRVCDFVYTKPYGFNKAVIGGALANSLFNFCTGPWHCGIFCTEIRNKTSCDHLWSWQPV